MRDIRFGWQDALVERSAAELERLLPPGFDPALAGKLRLRLDSRTGVVRSQAHGTTAALRPVDENLPNRVTEEEAAVYGQFRDAYARYWRQFIDPVGVRFQLDERELRVDTLILPLIENTAYAELRRLVGPLVDPSESSSKPVALPPKALGALTFATSGAGGGLGRLLTGMGRPLSEIGLELDPEWLGNTLTLGVTDGDLFLTATSRMSDFFLRGLGRGWSLAAAAFISSLTLPVFAAIEIEDAEAMQSFLDRVLLVAAREARRKFGVVHYSAPGEPRIDTVTFTLFVVELRVHYAFVGDRLLVATRLGLLEDWIAALEKRAGEDRFAAHGRLSVFPQACRLAARMIGIAWQERIAETCRANLAPLSRAGRAGWFERAESFLGYRAFCPEGGRYELASGEVRCTLHGTRTQPLQPLAPSSTAPAVRLVNDMESLSVEFELTEDGLRSRLEVDFDASRPRPGSERD